MWCPKKGGFQKVLEEEAHFFGCDIFFQVTMWRVAESRVHSREAEKMLALQIYFKLSKRFRLFRFVFYISHSIHFLECEDMFILFLIFFFCISACSFTLSPMIVHLILFLVSAIRVSGIRDWSQEFLGLWIIFKITFLRLADWKPL
jgi:hypothetical protein